MPQSYRINGWDEDYDGRNWVYSKDCPNFDVCGGTIHESEHDVLCKACRRKLDEAQAAKSGDSPPQ